ncbi:hypothetical protein S4A8_02803 [Salinisphaera sp. S4-8]|uniref:metallophosphoesterase n=1 Tax=Salinisphaera sp. S4-8 TaxID=633357 RepID=UPI00333E82AC
MRIRVLSDLHLECLDNPTDAGIVDDIECDVVVLAGDIANGVDGLEWAADTFASRQIVYVMGNHEYYDQDMHYTLARAREDAPRLGIHLLEKDEVRLNGIRFLGCTLWSGFDSRAHSWREITDLAHMVLADFSYIGNGDKAFTPLAMTLAHEESRIWLENMLDDAMPSVVVTHFSPVPIGINPYFDGRDLLTSYFHNDLSHLLRARTPLWIHGHHHHSFDTWVEGDNGRTRVVSNQLGYANEPTGFAPEYVVDAQ